MRLVSVFIAMAAIVASGNAQALDPDPLLHLAKRAYGEYMVQSGGCTVTTQAFMGWAAGTLRRCTYAVQARYRDGTTRNKPGLVYLATFPPERLLAWLKTACAKAAPTSAPAACITSLTDVIRGASGAQFAVAGLVWEDQLCNDHRGQCRYAGDKRGKSQALGDGVYEPYVFRGGVTVRVAGVENGSVNRPGTKHLLLPTRAELQSYVTSPILGLSVQKGFARIASTTRASFARLSHRDDVPIGRGDAQAALAWSGIVDDAFRAALASSDNPLLDARACQGHGWPFTCR